MGSVLGASYLVHVADQHPDLVDRLLLIAPAGVSSLRPNPLCGMTYQMLRLPGLSSAVYGSNTSRYSILEHLQKDVYENEEIAGQSEVDWRYWISHRPNADSVERSRISGLLNTDIRAAAARLNQSILIAWGRHCKQPPVADAEEFCELNPKARIDIFERSAMVPHEEEPNRFNEMAKAFFYTGSPVMH
jgi:pimeloyl-ACP methyl ester carboxylesterase